MDDRTKSAIIEYVKRLDPKGEIVRLVPTDDLRGGEIQFSDRMVQSRIETALKGEKYVEAYLAVKLVRELGYSPDTFQLQTAYLVGHTKPERDRPRIDVIIRQEDGPQPGRAYFFIETKDPDEFDEDRESLIERQLYLLADHERTNGVKYLVFFTVELQGDRLVDRADIIDFDHYPTFKEWSESGRVSVDLLPADYGLARKSKFVKKPPEKLLPGERLLNTTAGPDVFAALRNNLHDVLWGGGGMFYNDIFTNLVKIFLAKVYDEDTLPEYDEGKQPEPTYRFQIEMVGDRPQSSAEVTNKINDLLQQAQRGYLGYTEEQVKKSRGIDTEKLSEAKVAYVVERLQEFSLIENSNPDNGDVLGEFFEGIVEKGFKQSRGQFFTHRNIVHFLIHALRIPERAVELANGIENPLKPRLPYICDPSCGSGTFLIEAMKAVSNEVVSSPKLVRQRRSQGFLEQWFTPSNKHQWADNYIYGMEINPDLALATKVNMVLHRDGSINIYSSDGLASFDTYRCPTETKVSALLNNSANKKSPYKFAVNEQFDFILTNPPFSIKPDEATKADYRQRFEFGTSPKSESIFLERWYQLLRPGGRVGAVLPESVFDTGSNLKTRLFLFRYFRVDAVVALPYLAFKPFTSTKTSVLIATKKNAEEVAAYDKLWVSSLAAFRKASKRAKKYAGTATPESVAKTIAKDSEFERRALGELIGVESVEAAELAERLSQFDVKLLDLIDETHWVFRQVSEKFDYPIFYASLSQVGYKRRLAGGELRQENDLFVRDQNGDVSLKDSQDLALGVMLNGSAAQPSVKGFFSNFADIGKQSSLRCDSKYRWFWDHLHGKIIPDSKHEHVPLSKFVQLGSQEFVKKGILDRTRKLVELGDVEGKTGHVKSSHPVDSVGSNKIEFGDNDIMFNKLEPYLCKVVLNDPQKAYIGSTEWVPLKVNEEYALKEFIWTLLRSDVGEEVFRLVQAGKRHARIDIQTDFFSLLVPDVPKEEQQKAIDSLKPLWERLDMLRQETKSVTKDAQDCVRATLSGS